MVIDLELPSTVKQVRIDPGMLSCITTVKEVVLNGELVPVTESKRILTNGKTIMNKESQMLTATFETRDPNIVIRVGDMVKSTGNSFRATIQTVFLPEDMAGVLQKELKKKIRL